MIKRRIKLIKALFYDAGRIEYFCADLTPYFIGVILGFAVSGIDIINPYVLKLFLEGLLLIVLAHFAAVYSNVYSDYELDKRFKPKLPAAADIIGLSQLKLIFSIITLIGTIVAIDISYTLVKVELFIFWIIGVGLAHIYTLEPIRLKKYPFIGDIARGIPIIIPMLFGFYMFSDNDNGVLLYNFIGIFVNLMGLFLIGEVWDWKDDKGFVCTIAVVFGYKKALLYGLILISCGIAVWTIGNCLIYPLKVIYLYSIVGIFLLSCFILYSIMNIYKHRFDYNKIEYKCGMITKIGTSLIWLYQLIGAIIILMHVQ
ncbi:MAG: UbiA family prenyltransferase [Bacteroidales bacterium]|jgi:4-hydroxybenzoate polyprenyltransferase|nr:UbiA family prenyltransferase [Bacteroidales bacterium]